MEIKFSDGWWIKTFDSRNLVTEKDGDVDGYWPNLESAFLGLLDQKILVSDKKSIQEVVDLINETKKEILEKLEKIKNG